MSAYIYARKGTKLKDTKMEEKTCIEWGSDAIRRERKCTYKRNGVCREQCLEEIYSRKKIPLFDAN